MQFDLVHPNKYNKVQSPLPQKPQRNARSNNLNLYNKVDLLCIRHPPPPINATTKINIIKMISLIFFMNIQIENKIYTMTAYPPVDSPDVWHTQFPGSPYSAQTMRAYSINMPLCASTGPVLATNAASIGPVQARHWQRTVCLQGIDLYVWLVFCPCE